jgi:hypothetical protein
MTAEMSYCNGIACLPRGSGTKAGVLEYVRQAKRDAAFHGISWQLPSVDTRPNRQNRTIASPSLGGEGWGEGELNTNIFGRAHASRVPYSASRRIHPLSLRGSRPYPKSTLGLTAQPLIWVNNTFSKSLPPRLKASFCPRKTQKTSRSNQNQTDSGQKINRQLPVQTFHPFLASQSLSRLIKPFFKNPFLFPALAAPKPWRRRVLSLNLGRGTFPVSFGRLRSATEDPGGRGFVSINPSLQSCGIPNFQKRPRSMQCL